MKHNFEHTPGPYTWSYNKDDRYESGEIMNSDGDVLAIVSGSNYGLYLNSHTEEWDEEGSTKEHIANARLFAKAPEMFEHLEMLFKAVSAVVVGDHFAETQKLIEYVRGTIEQPEEKKPDPIEEKAKVIYNRWGKMKMVGWVPWVEGGNSHKQNEARELARNPDYPHSVDIYL